MLTMQEKNKRNETRLTPSLCSRTLSNKMKNACIVFVSKFVRFPFLNVGESLSNPRKNCRLV